MCHAKGSFGLRRQNTRQPKNIAFRKKPQKRRGWGLPNARKRAILELGGDGGGARLHASFFCSIESNGKGRTVTIGVVLPFGLHGSGSWIRTNDLRVMGSTSYCCDYPVAQNIELSNGSHLRGESLSQMVELTLVCACFVFCGWPDKGH